MSYIQLKVFLYFVFAVRESKQLDADAHALLIVSAVLGG